MNAYTRIGMYLFIVGAILSVMDSAFPVDPSMRGYIYVALIFTGIFAGLLNVTPDEEHKFLLSCGVFLLVIIGFNQVFAGDPIIAGFTHFFQNGIAFVGSMAFVVAVKSILEYGSDNVQRGVPGEDLYATTKNTAQLSTSKHAWRAVVFAAVALTFIVLLLDLFFDLPATLMTLFDLLYWLIIIIFVADLFVLYRQADSWGKFLRHSWLDIVAAIPFYGLLGAGVGTIAKLPLTLKFFSRESTGYLRRRDYVQQTKPGRATKR